MTEHIDPAFRTDVPYPAPASDTRPWLYPSGEYESFELARMRRDVERLRLRVGYPGFFRAPSPVAWFRFDGVPNAEIAFELSGKPTPLVGTLTPTGARLDESGRLVLRIEADPTVRMPAVCAADAQGWTASLDGTDFASVVSGGPPTGFVYTRMEIPLAEIAPGLYDAGRELLADIRFDGPSDTPPVFTLGESRYEAENVTPANAEQTAELVPDGPGAWRTVLPLAVRYIKLAPGAPCAPHVFACFAPERYRAPYVSTDPELTRIWETAAYTLRLCKGVFLIDGIKRDRLPWGGDLAISLLSDAAVFGDPAPVCRTLTLLGRDIITKSHANGIIDYSLWLVVCHQLLQEQYGEDGFIRSHFHEVRRVLDWFVARAREDGGLVLPRSEEWCFIDWLDMPKSTALNMLFRWALACGIRLAEHVGDTGSRDTWQDSLACLDELLLTHVFDRETGLFPGDVAQSGPPTRHANFLAVLSGLVGPGHPAARTIANALSSPDGLPPDGTPYMSALEIWALHKLGRTEAALERLRRIWGGMLRLGATTFFEGWSDNLDERTSCSFYDRPFGMSLCHAWSSAPSFLLPMLEHSCFPTL